MSTEMHRNARGGQPLVPFNPPSSPSPHFPQARCFLSCNWNYCPPSKNNPQPPSSVSQATFLGQVCPPCPLSSLANFLG